MAIRLRSSSQRAWHRELIVPGVMVGAIACYAYDAMDLSVPALILPIAIIIVVIAALLWVVATAGRTAGSGDHVASPERDESSARSIVSAKHWLLVAIPLVLTVLMEYAGALAALTLLVLLAQLTFSAKSPLRSLLIAIAVTVPTYLLFEHVLYVRFPVGPLGMG